MPDREGRATKLPQKLSFDLQQGNIPGQTPPLLTASETLEGSCTSTDLTPVFKPFGVPDPHSFHKVQTWMKGASAAAGDSSSFSWGLRVGKLEFKLRSI